MLQRIPSFALGALLCSFSLTAAEVVLNRVTNGSKATIGTISVKGQVICDFLEYPTHAPFKFLNPGTYDAFTRNDGSKGWRIELKGTAPFENIQIHVGNSLPNTQGCFLAGYKADADKPFIENSVKALAILKKAIDAAGGDLKVTINNP